MKVVSWNAENALRCLPAPPTIVEALGPDSRYPNMITSGRTLLPESPCALAATPSPNAPDGRMRSRLESQEHSQTDGRR
jgi:hypothetical protein